MDIPADPKRRILISAIAASPLLGACATRLGKPGSPAFVVTLTGQALIGHDICAAGYPGFSEVVAEIRKGDVAITDLETAIRTPASGPSMRSGTFLHVGTPRELACVREMGFDALALANNHAGDLGREGVMATRNEVLRQGFAAAGTGRNLGEATRAAQFSSGGKAISLVAMATGKVQPFAVANETLPGVNELRLDVDGEPNREDVKRICESISEARVNSEHVVAYLHNHDWRDDMSVTQEWSRRFAKGCIDAGANIFFSHGAPLLHGIELHGKAPALYGLGSLVFHSRTPPGHYKPEVWQSAIAHLRFVEDRLVQIELVPISLNEMGDAPANHDQTRGRPRIATGAAASAILERLRKSSQRFGTQVQIAGERAFIHLDP